MSYSRRQLEAFGEPLGNSVTRKEGGRIIYGGGGSSSGPSSTTQTQDLPDWAKPYAQEVLGVGSSLGFTRDATSGQITGLQPYQQYGGERTAQFTPLQQQAFQGAQNMGPSASTTQGANIAGQAAQQALGTNYQPTQATNQFKAPKQYTAGQFDAGQVSAGGLNQYQMGPAERVSTQSFVQPGTADAYMSPYMQSVVAMQQREAMRTSEMQRNQNQAQAVGQGAFGGSRQAIVEAERQRNLGTQLGDIQATGSQAAFQQAQQQFNAEQGRGLTAQQSNQAAGLTVGQQNLQSQLGVQQLGATQNLQAQLANQSAGLQAQQLGEQSRQFGANQGLTAAQTAAQYGLAAQQLGEQSRQYGAGLGLQGLQTALTGAGQLGSLGQQQFSQGLQANQLQNQYGTQQQQQVQNVLNQGYEDFLAEKRNPYQQVEYMSNLLRGTPSGSTQTMYTAAPSAASQAVGLGTAALGVAQLTRAKGGTVSSYAKGGAVKKKQKSAGLAELALSKI
jgi:hypothetical protein